MKYVVEWQMGGEITIDTEGTDWTPEELDSQVGQAIAEGAEKVGAALSDEFDDCDVDGDGVSEYKLRRIS